MTHGFQDETCQSVSRGESRQRRQTAEIDARWTAGSARRTPIEVGQIYLLTTRCSSARWSVPEHQTAPVGRWGTTGPELHLRPPQPGHPTRRHGHDLHRGTRCGRSGDGRQRMAGRHLFAVLPRCPAVEIGMHALFNSVLVPRRYPSHVALGPPGSIRRGRRTRCRCPRVRRSVRQP